MFLSIHLLGRQDNNHYYSYFVSAETEFQGSWDLPKIEDVSIDISMPRSAFLHYCITSLLLWNKFRVERRSYLRMLGVAFTVKVGWWWWFAISACEHKPSSYSGVVRYGLGWLGGHLCIMDQGTWQKGKMLASPPSPPAPGKLITLRIMTWNSMVNWRANLVL